MDAVDCRRSRSERANSRLSREVKLIFNIISCCCWCAGFIFLIVVAFSYSFRFSFFPFFLLLFFFSFFSFLLWLRFVSGSVRQARLLFLLSFQLRNGHCWFEQKCPAAAIWKAKRGEKWAQGLFAGSAGNDSSRQRDEFQRMPLWNLKPRPWDWMDFRKYLGHDATYRWPDTQIRWQIDRKS